MITTVSAQLMATLHVLQHRMTQRNERGQTTAEYVGIVVFVALIALAIIAFATPLGNQAQGIVASALTKISEKLG